MLNKQKIRRIGLTMRVVEAVDYEEPRDALAHDWAEFMAFALPEVLWMPIPNIEKDISDYLRDWGIEGIILTGGNDIGASPKRDETEKQILSYALSEKIPVFGVCRGLQLLQVYCGGSLDVCVKEEHVATQHTVIMEEGNKEIEVNSYHNSGIREDHLHDKLMPFVKTLDGWVEGVNIKDFSIGAVMWHPERGRPFRNDDRALIRKYFGWDQE